MKKSIAHRPITSPFSALVTVFKKMYNRMMAICRSVVMPTIVLLTVTVGQNAYAQGVAINTTGAPADNSAMLDVSATNKGVLVPRMTATERDAISSPATGLLIYQTDGSSGFYYYDGAAWTAIGGSGGAHWDASGADIYNTNTGRVGIGTATPAARLHVADSSVVFTGPNPYYVTPAPPPVSGAGSRMMWYADKAAFRAGHAEGVEWDKDSVGIGSTAMGWGAKASGEGSTAMGSQTIASGDYSTAMGRATIASGYTSTAMGVGVTASGQSSVAMGRYIIANGDGSVGMGEGAYALGKNSIAMGYNATVVEEHSIAMGYNVVTAGEHCIAIGNNTYASGDYSTAMGTFSFTNGKTGSFAIGDSSAAAVQLANDADNQMAMRFAGGYKLYTNAGLSTGALMNGGDNSWSTISDKRKKENFVAVDGELFLKKISKFKLTSWNYKGQDAKTHRHYGPMAQDFYAAFGRDEYGTIGNDTTINQADMEGVSFVAIQALVKRTEELMGRVQTLERANSTLSNENQTLKAELSGRIATMEDELRKTKVSAK